MKFLFEEFITIERFEAEVSRLNQNREELDELLNLAKSSIHHQIIDLLLNELKVNEKQLLLMHLGSSNQNAIEFLKEYFENLEIKITEKVKSLEDELLTMLKTT